jgi:hypothetical protein
MDGSSEWQAAIKEGQDHLSKSTFHRQHQTRDLGIFQERDIHLITPKKFTMGSVHPA